MKRYLLVLIVFFIAIFISSYLNNKSVFRLQSNERILFINSNKFKVEVADTDAKRAQGLSGHKKLADNQGMLFIFPASGSYSFWMKEMTFPLDFVWINNGIVVDVTENVPSPRSISDKLPLYSPGTPVNWVLEISAGQIKNLEIKIGDKALLR